MVQQLQDKPYYLFLYLDALVDRDPHLVSEFADLQVSVVVSWMSVVGRCLGVGQVVCGVCYDAVD